MTIATRLKAESEFVPTTKIRVENSLPPNPQRHIVHSKDQVEQNLACAFYPNRKQPKNIQGVLKLYCVENFNHCPDENTTEFLIAEEPCNNLLYAVQVAANKRFPLALSPDVIWFTILQGLTTHLNLNPEILGDITDSLQTEQNHYVKENEKLDWSAIINSVSDIFNQKFRKNKNTGTQQRKISFAPYEVESIFNPLIATNSSTTASALSMKVCQGSQDPHFQKPAKLHAFRRYIVSVRSAIPEIHILGTSNDYQTIIDKVNEMSVTFGLDWWASELVPVLTEFVKAVNGDPDKHFWKYICNLNDKNGFYMPYSGWIQAFFPYIDDGSGNLVRNDFIGQWRAGYNEVMPPKIAKYPKKKFPTSMSITSVHIHLPETPAEPSKATATTATANTGEPPAKIEPVIRKMALKSGLVAVIQNKETLAVRPVFGYILAETQKASSPVNDSLGPEEELLPVFVPATRYKK